MNEIKLLRVIRAGIHKMLVKIANREDPDQTIKLFLKKQSDLGLHRLIVTVCTSWTKPFINWVRTAHL